MKVSGLFRYPVKSMGGQALARATITARGIEGDRRWMMVTPEGRFLTRRELPAMAQVEAVPHEAGGIELRRVGAPSLVVPEPSSQTSQVVTVWGERVEACVAGAQADAWLSDCFDRPVRLVHMARETVRPVDPAYGQSGDMVGFADGFPLLVTTTDSLAALNRQLETPVTMARFRPSLVIEGVGEAFAEEGWRTLRIGGLTLRVVKPCTRCVITTQDPLTGEGKGPEPLRTLRAMGRVWQKMPVFGMNAIPDGAGEIALGEAVELA
ncbi:MOSC domain-containing protein [Novosphingobium pituita]|uniref:MOSC domain-containing protein n=1 Tax=Novosphingobium pituita TaxID=3056842 RepID=A0ABQ6P3W7_9SPHN|nr:MOSC N-terminal beta barrel domain-containing protein [Novosphingobium sp. IK01]MDK4805739.1 MOSC domain-containing protein [Novosphingobium aromaticivorans]GMM59254.1 MOSC domain-containing protein [Novosphingobium sp. IK01]